MNYESSERKSWNQDINYEYYEIFEFDEIKMKENDNDNNDNDNSYNQIIIYNMKMINKIYI